jgi:hypothetical protein
MKTFNSCTFYIVLFFLVLACSSKKPSYTQKVEAPIASNGVPFNLFLYKQDTSITITTSHGTAVKIEPNTFAHMDGSPVSNQIMIKIREMHSAQDIFKSGIPYKVQARFGWNSVPENVEQAAAELMKDYFSKDTMWRNKYVKNISTFDWDFEYTGDAYTGTGNAYADNLLADYVLTAKAEII